MKFQGQAIKREGDLSSPSLCPSPPHPHPSPTQHRGLGAKWLAAPTPQVQLPTALSPVTRAPPPIGAALSQRVLHPHLFSLEDNPCLQTGPAQTQSGREKISSTQSQQRPCWLPFSLTSAPCCRESSFPPWLNLPKLRRQGIFY